MIPWLRMHALNAFVLASLNHRELNNDKLEVSAYAIADIWHLFTIVD